jgi:hypothetical protein
VSPDVKRTTYVSEGARGFPRGTQVTQFYYPDPITHNGYTLDLALLPNGRTHYVHEWGNLERTYLLTSRRGSCLCCTARTTLSRAYAAYRSQALSRR